MCRPDRVILRRLLVVRIDILVRIVKLAGILRVKVVPAGRMATTRDRVSAERIVPRLRVRRVRMLVVLLVQILVRFGVRVHAGLLAICRLSGLGAKSSNTRGGGSRHSVARSSQVGSIVVVPAGRIFIVVLAHVLFGLSMDIRASIITSILRHGRIGLFVVKVIHVASRVMSRGGGCSSSGSDIAVESLTSSSLEHEEDKRKDTGRHTETDDDKRSRDGTSVVEERARAALAGRRVVQAGRVGDDLSDSPDFTGFVGACSRLGDEGGLGRDDVALTVRGGNVDSRGESRDGRRGRGRRRCGRCGARGRGG